MGVVNREEEIRAMNISKTYTRGGKSVSALKPLNLEVYNGEFIVILGPSGSGKSTLLNLLSGLSAPSTGQVRFREDILGDLSSVELAQLRRFQMGFVFQQFYLLQHLTALENVLVPLTFKTHLTMKEQQERAAEVLDSVGLSHRLHHMPGELSGGEQQRVAIARAVANEPYVVFADEPTGNLDRRSAETVMSLFRRLNSTLGTTIVAVTHDVAFRDVAGRILQIEDCEIVVDGGVN